MIVALKNWNFFLLVKLDKMAAQAHPHAFRRRFIAFQRCGVALDDFQDTANLWALTIRHLVMVHDHLGHLGGVAERTGGGAVVAALVV